MSESFSIEPGQWSKTGRDGAAVIGPLVLATIVANSVELGTLFGIEGELLVAGASFVAALFGWRFARSSA